MEPRFEFGENWRRFLGVLDETRIQEAQAALGALLGRQRLDGLSFLDVGCGSGLSSLAARRLGATVHSFDYDPQSVACTQELRARFDGGCGDQWRVEQGSALDEAYLGTLGLHDVVHAWGVLHHTGAMWEAVRLTSGLVRDGGLLVLALYNDQGAKSRFWKAVKRTYVALPRQARAPFTAAVLAPFELRNLLRSTLAGRPGDYVRTWTRYHERRGMSRWHDMVDWVGGYPFEVATPGQVHAACEARGFVLEREFLSTSLGCNEFVFRKVIARADPPAHGPHDQGAHGRCAAELTDATTDGPGSAVR